MPLRTMESSMPYRPHSSHFRRRRHRPKLESVPTCRPQRSQPWGCITRLDGTMTVHTFNSCPRLVVSNPSATRGSCTTACARGARCLIQIPQPLPYRLPHSRRRRCHRHHRHHPLHHHPRHRRRRRRHRHLPHRRRLARRHPHRRRPVRRWSPPFPPRRACAATPTHRLLHRRPRRRRPHRRPRHHHACLPRLRRRRPARHRAFRPTRPWATSVSIAAV